MFPKWERWPYHIQKITQSVLGIKNFLFYSFYFCCYKNINITLELQENKMRFHITILKIITVFVIATYKNSSIILLLEHEKRLCTSDCHCSMTSISCGRFHCTLYEVSFHILCIAVLYFSCTKCICLESMKPEND